MYLYVWLMPWCLCFFFLFFHWNTRVSLPWVKPCKVLTVHFHFTESKKGVIRIPLRIRRMSPVVIVDDVSPVVRTGDVDRIRYRNPCVVGVPKTQHSVLFICCVGDVYRESQDVPRVPIFIERTIITKHAIFTKTTEKIL